MKKQYLIISIVFFAIMLLFFALSASMLAEETMQISNRLMIPGLIAMGFAIITLIIGVLTKEVTTQKERIQKKIILWTLFAITAVCMLYADIIHPVLFKESNLRDVRLSFISIFIIVLAFWGVIGLLKKNKEKQVQQLQS